MYIQPVVKLVLVLGVALVGCSSDSEWRTFYGIEYRTTKASTSHVVDSVLPGPDGLGGSPVGERPTVTISEAGPHGFYVTITKTKERLTIDSEEGTFTSNAKLVGTSTAIGWELSGEQATGDGRTLVIHEIYADLAGGHYECTYADVNCADVVPADALCRSMRGK